MKSTFLFGVTANSKTQRVLHFPKVEVWKVIHNFLQMYFVYKKYGFSLHPLHPMAGNWATDVVGLTANIEPIG